MPTSDPLAFVRYLDVVVVVLAAPVRAAAGWADARVHGRRRRLDLRRASLGALVERYARTRDYKAQIALNFGVLMGRVWIVGIAILVVGKTARSGDGLMAALLALVAFTIYLATSLILRPSERNTPRS